MQYLIARDGQQLGQFSEEEIRSGLFEGRYQPTDSAWTEGMEDWKPLGEIMGQGLAQVRTPKAMEAAGALKAAPTRATGIVVAALALVGVGIVFALSMGAYGNIREKKGLTEGLTLAHKLSIAVRMYAADSGGKYPATLEELVTAGKLTKATLDEAQSFKPKGWEGEPGFEYFGAQLNESSEGGKPLLRCRCWMAGGKKRFIVSNDGSVELDKVP
jgi:hypothetical protein